MFSFQQNDCVGKLANNDRAPANTYHLLSSFDPCLGCVYVPYRLRFSVGGKLSMIDSQDLSTVTMDLSSFTPTNSKG